LQPPAIAQEGPWLTDEQARDIAAGAVHAKYPQPCYSTYRDERLEGILLHVRKRGATVSEFLTVGCCSGAL
jgi:hypothetical protein